MILGKPIPFLLLLLLLFFHLFLLLFFLLNEKVDCQLNCCHYVEIIFTQRKKSILVKTNIHVARSLSPILFLFFFLLLLLLLDKKIT